MKYPFDFLWIEFPTKKLVSTLARLRFKVMLRPDIISSEKGLKIMMKGDPLWNKGNRKSAQNVIYVNAYFPRKQFEEDVQDFISQRFETSKDAIKLKWEKGNIVELLREEN